jgi:hypothetical protein
MQGSVFTLTSGVYSETNISSSSNYIVIRAQAGHNVTIQCIASQSGAPCFSLTGNNVQLQGITVTTDPSASAFQAPMYSIAAGLSHTFVNMTFTGITCSGCQGAAVNVQGTLNLQSSVFTRNSAYNGGAVACIGTSGTITATTSSFTQNQAGTGGAMFSSGCTVSISSTYFGLNTAATSGGAVQIESTTGTFGTGTSFYRNSVTGANSLGGAASIKGSVLTFANTSFQSNVAPNLGGAMYVEVSTITMQGVTASSNQIQSATADCGTTCAGAAVYCTGQRSFTIDSSSFSSNIVTLASTPTLYQGQGGAVALSGCTMTVTGSTFNGNAASLGGAIALWTQATLDIGGTTSASNLVSNVASSQGGALYASASTITLRGACNFQQNSAVVGGGAAAFASAATGLAVSNGQIRFSQNSVSAGGGGAVFWDQSASGAVEPVVQGPCCVHTNNNAPYGRNIATPAMSVIWGRVMPTSVVAAARSSLLATNAVQSTEFSYDLNMLDGYKQIVASDNTTVITLSAYNTLVGATPAALISANSSTPFVFSGRGAMSLNGMYSASTLSQSIAKTDILGTISCTSKLGHCFFGSSDNDAFKVNLDLLFQSS